MSLFCITAIKTRPPQRSFFQWLNIIFNKLDYDRKKIVGANRVCAEWLLRNGAAVKWTHDSEFLRDYNRLPDEEIRLHIEEVDATDSSITHDGFEHFTGCEHIRKIIFHKCNYLEDKALPQLKVLEKSLNYLQITSCLNITDKGLISLSPLTNLKDLILGDLPYVKDKDKVVGSLKNALSKCNIVFK